MRRCVLALLVLALLLGLAACGSSAGGSTPSEPTAAPETAAPTPTEAPATPAPTAAPTAEPTPEPTPEQTPEPTETPDWESLGGTVYETKAGGYAGYVHVSVVLDAEGRILDVTVGQHNESEGYGEKAIDVIPGLIVERQSLGVDAVSGATFTSEAIIKATAKAITAAGLDPADYGFAP